MINKDKKKTNDSVMTVYCVLYVCVSLFDSRKHSPKQSPDISIVTIAEIEIALRLWNFIVHNNE